MNLKIFLTYHNNSKKIQNDIFKPIHVGAEIASQHVVHNLSDMYSDNRGLNISEKNKTYCELTAQYWAWKNYEKIDNPDYVGFMHYRRHFLFDKNLPEINILGCREFDNLDDDYKQKIGFFDSSLIENIVSKYDCIVGEKVDFTKFADFAQNKADFNSRWAYCTNKGLHEKDYDYMLNSIKKHFPEYGYIVDKFDKLTYNYWYNMFIMKKDLFFRYQNFLFTILEDCEKNMDMTYYDSQGVRTLGYLGERLLTIFVLKLQEENNVYIKEVPISFVKNTTAQEELLPAFENNYAVLAMSSSDEYVPYLSVCLESIKRVAKPENNYDIIIFERSISDKNKQVLQNQMECDNISLRFINPMEIIKNYDLKFPPFYNLECYFRLACPLILRNFEKVIFTDVDLLYFKDPMDLYRQDVKGFPLAACQDFIMGALINNSEDPMAWLNYTKEVLKLENPYMYFNTGVMLINIPYFNQNNLSFKLLDLVSKNEYRILEQDGLNSYCKTNIKYIDTAWNFPVANEYYLSILELMPFKFIEKYNKDKKQPYIMHYAGIAKPWNELNENMVENWWICARYSPFYEKIISKCLALQEEKLHNKMQVIKENKFKYYKYKILSRLTWGKTNKRHKYKYKQLKALIKGENNIAI